jgi:hypothetical protein
VRAREAALAAALVLGAILPAACEEAPRDVSLQATPRDPPGAKLAVQECGSCHMPYRPLFLPARSWTALMSHLASHFGEDASVDPATTRQITAYLVSNAADSPGGNRRVMAGLSSSDAPLRITDMPFWRRIHRRDLAPGVGSGEGMRTAANCGRCHNGSGEAEEE